MATRKTPRPRARKSRAGREIEALPNVPVATEFGRELVVVVNQEPGGSLAGFRSASEADLAPLADLLASEGITLQPLFGLNQERIAARLAARAVNERAAKTGIEPPNLSAFYRAVAPDDRLKEIAARLREHDGVEAAYVKPRPEPPVIYAASPSPEPAAPLTPDYTSRQGYLNPAPEGVDAPYAWSINRGGGGWGVRVVDIEYAWRFSHEDLLQNHGGVVGTQPDILGLRNHGTAVVGVIGGDRNNNNNAYGVTGISPEAIVHGVVREISTGQAIRQAADMLSAGDIILIELHAPGPLYDFTPREDQRGYIPVEWWPDEMLGIQYAVSQGVIVVEAAGNGEENLDDPIYDRNPPEDPFPSWWRNPFRRNPIDPGAILVGAGAPPPYTHDNYWGDDRSRLKFSNYGAALDAQGWGVEVTTTGVGDLQGGANEDLWYTDTFNGTSSASPVVVGALACAQGARIAVGLPLLTPAAARHLLRTTGSPQQDGYYGPATQRIGNRPNLRQLINIGPTPPHNTVPLYRYWNARAGDHFYTTAWEELRGGKHGYVYEGGQCHVLPQQLAGTVPLYRYWNAQAGDHFYTTNWDELREGKHGYVFEARQCYVYPHQVSNTVPLYRYYSSAATNHFYTTNPNELGGTSGYVYEGVQCFVYTQPMLVPSAFGSPSTEEASSGAPTPQGTAAFGAAPETMSQIPATFRMGAPPYVPSSPFNTSEGEEGGGQISPKDSFTFKGNTGSFSEAQEGVREVTININLGSRKDSKG